MTAVGAGRALDRAEAAGAARDTAACPTAVSTRSSFIPNSAASLSLLRPRPPPPPPRPPRPPLVVATLGLLLRRAFASAGLAPAPSRDRVTTLCALPRFVQCASRVSRAMVRGSMGASSSKCSSMDAALRQRKSYLDLPGGREGARVRSKQGDTAGTIGATQTQIQTQIQTQSQSQSQSQTQRRQARTSFVGCKMASHKVEQSDRS